MVSLLPNEIPALCCQYLGSTGALFSVFASSFFGAGEDLGVFLALKLSSLLKLKNYL